MTRLSRSWRIPLVLAGAIAVVLLVVACGGAAGDGTSSVPAAPVSSGAAAKVTFLELGADKCVLSTAFATGHCGVIVAAGTAAQEVQSWASWGDRSGVTMRVRALPAISWCSRACI